LPGDGGETMSRDLAGVFDTHVHTAPDVRPRKVTAYELCSAAVEAGMAGVMLKCHHASTAMVAGALRQAFPGLRVMGSIVLNRAVGGLNVEAVDAAIRMGIQEVWLPTLDAENERVYRGQPGTGLEVLDERGAVRPELMEILELMAAAEVILGTGHLSAAEIEVVVAAARERGVRRIFVTHPESNFQRLPVEFQLRIRGEGLYFERCFVREGFSASWEVMAAGIRTVGVESTIFATDLGQVESPHPLDGLREGRQRLRDLGFGESELRRMTIENAKEALR